MGWLNKYKELFKDKDYILSVIYGILLVIIGGYFTSLAQSYANRFTENAINDLLLDNLPAFPYPNFLVNFVIWGSILVAFLALLFSALRPKYLPVGLKTVGLLYIIRAFFIPLTNLSVHTGKIPTPDLGGLGELVYGSNDLFFSGHTALPFIVALVFWNIKPVRNLFLVFTILMGLGVLLSKSHYSIDVFAALFMGYAIYKIANYFFKRDFARLAEA